MRVIEPGHTYVLEHAPAGTGGQVVTFVNREAEPHDGTLSQELLRANIDCMEVLIDRTNHCDACLLWEGNDRIIKALSEAQRQMRLALLFHEQRAMERKMEKHGVMPESVPTAEDGHFVYPPEVGSDFVCMSRREIEDLRNQVRIFTDKSQLEPGDEIAVVSRRYLEKLTAENRPSFAVPTKGRLSDGRVIEIGDEIRGNGRVFRNGKEILPPACMDNKYSGPQGSEAGQSVVPATGEVVTMCSKGYGVGTGYGLRCKLREGHEGACTLEKGTTT